MANHPTAEQVKGDQSRSVKEVIEVSLSKGGKNLKIMILQTKLVRSG